MLLIVALSAQLSSCGIRLNELRYMNKVEPGIVFKGTPGPENYKIRANDQLYIKVIGDDPINTAFLNLVEAQSLSNLQNIELITFMVDRNGDINYPQLGLVRVAGKTVQEVQQSLQEMVNNYVLNTSVHVKLVNRTITVLGEVRQPGMKPMNNNFLTIFEALGTANDITDYGNRRKVKLIRETTEGQKVVELDLTDPKLIYSDYYYVMPHDLIYVEPRNKIYGYKTLPYMSHFSLAISLVTTAVLILNYYK